MPYKIYTYENPYKINETDFWEEISSLPHLCVARTLVNGLRDIMRDSIHGLLSELDEFVSHELVYKRWTDNISLRIQQYSYLTTIFKRLLNDKLIDEMFYRAISQNQTQFLDALRLFIELGIPASVLDNNKGNKEQQLFIKILEELQTSSLFEFPTTPDCITLKKVLISLAQNELSEFEERKSNFQKDKQWFENSLKITESQMFDSIVIHGVHQFSPTQLRLLTELDKMGITVIFLFNYQRKYSKLYSSWHDIYSCFEVPIHCDVNIEKYEMHVMQNPSNALANAIATIYEGNSKIGEKCFKSWHQLFKNIKFYEFTNITEYAHHISNHLDAAKQRYRESLTIKERGEGVWKKNTVLKYLDEQVYTANNDIHKLLKIYYPEYANSRHFLSYPIGQFFSAIYRLWDYKCKAIKIDIPAIKECLSSNILKSGSGEILLRTFYNIEHLFSCIETFEQFENQIRKHYKQYYYKVINSKPTEQSYLLKQLSSYNKYTLTKKDLEALIMAINEINEIAKFIFATDINSEDYINFGTHFKKLESFLKQRELTLANEEERALINALQERLSNTMSDNSLFSGTFRDLQEGLYYYLKQKNNDDSVDWIVKNFEQIDGDILQSKRQYENNEKKVYHFACLSDYDLNCQIDDLLPWPLTDNFIKKAYSPVDLQFQVYYSSISERGNFLKYALFSGLCYNLCDVKLSYVKQIGDKIVEPFSTLSILGLIPLSRIVEEVKSSTQYSISISQKIIDSVKCNKYQMMDMFLCPHRFFMDYVVEDAPVFRGDFFHQHFFEYMLVRAVWKRIEGKQRSHIEKKISHIIQEESVKLRPYFFYWKQTTFINIEQRAKNYLIHKIINSNNNFISSYNDVHMSIRRLYTKALFSVDITDYEPVNSYAQFESLTYKEYPRKKYSLHKINNIDEHRKNLLLEDIKKFLNQVKDDDKAAIHSDWCTYCTQRGICMEPFVL